MPEGVAIGNMIGRPNDNKTYHPGDCIRTEQLAVLAKIGRPLFPATVSTRGKMASEKRVNSS